ncbi:Modification methylase DpnIIB [Symmachiella dynata]|uniref:site-specific DNA-methyltransferase n=1 Tax=Symmachiella dynata TaxID=2527995 RepID=UPI00118A80CA|nr:site-specific DNA-methyltransferase [Symmachiella dynata]QDT47223.1 Modification methylase DpnIIB [Symmachiella dynata]
MAKKKATKKKTTKKTVEALTHDDARRSNIPTAELQSVMGADEQNPIRVAYERRNRDLDPQLVWKGKDEQDWSDLVVHAPPLYIQEKVHPKVLVEDLLRESEARAGAGQEQQLDLFADFNGLPDAGKSAEFYQHEGNWTNRMILGDSLQVMASLAEREGLRGKVQCIYIDPPYGIKFNSNFQWSTTSRDVKDGKADHVTREPEQVKAFRDTWRDGIHSYLTYLRDRLTVARDLLAQTGSIFVQIGDENEHRIRVLMDEVFGDENFCSCITYRTSVPLTSIGLPGISDRIIWYAKDKPSYKYRDLFEYRDFGDKSRFTNVEFPNGAIRGITVEEKRDLGSLPKDGKVFSVENLVSSGYTPTCTFDFKFENVVYETSSRKSWKTNLNGMQQLAKAGRLGNSGRTLRYKFYLDDYPVKKIPNTWMDTAGDSDKLYVVQTHSKVIQRCILMSSDPGDLVIDPTCGSGTTAYVAEQWGRRWITIDTSRVALTLARARVMGARYPYYILSDSPEGKQKEAEVTRTEPSTVPTYGNIRQGFAYERVPHITLGSIANNAEIDVIWEEFQETLEPLRAKLNKVLKQKWEEWEIPSEAADDWSEEAKKLHADWWEARIARQQEIDASIAAKADHEYLYDKPYEDKKKVRVAGPFTVESISPHRVLGVDENDELIDDRRAKADSGDGQADFVQMVLDNLQTSGVQQSAKADRIAFTSISGWPGAYIAAEGRYVEGESEDAPEKRAGIFIGPEFGTVARQDLVRAAREAGDAGFDVVIACAFNFDAHSAEFNKLGAIPVLKARMNADLHMADDLKNTGKGNLFVIFGEPDIDILDADGGQIQVKINGVDVFHPQTGEVHSDDADGIACWFVDTDYNEESFFVRHAYFLGANDPYKSLKTTLKAEIDREAWESLNSDTSRPFEKPKSGRIAVKVINHLGDEVMKVFRVE